MKYANAHRRNGAQGNIGNRYGCCRRRCRDTCAQGAIQFGNGFPGVALEVYGGLFHGLHRSTVRSRSTRVDKGRCNCGAEIQSKPHQHEAGDVANVAQGVHGAIIAVGKKVAYTDFMVI